LIDQFLNPKPNQRTDEYGGSDTKRMRFAVEVAEAVSKKISPDRVGFRLSPHNPFNDLADKYDGQDEFYAELSAKLSNLGLVYLHLISGNPATANATKLIRENFKSGALILNGGYQLERAETDLQSKAADLISYGMPFISNPQLPLKLKEGAPLVPADINTFYTPGEKGYTDYV
jgi:N-ethylmaleimide reductase